MASFAFDTAQPVQRQAAGQTVAVPRVGLSGGQVQGGVVNPVQQTEYRQESELPEFLTKAFAPQIERAQARLAFKGAADAYSKEAYKEIAADKPKWASTFGPSAYEGGAANYYANQIAVTDYFKTLNDRVKSGGFNSMTKEQMQVEVMNGVAGIMTGDADADALIENGVLQNLGPFIMTATKAKDAYDQQQGINTMSKAVSNASDLYTDAARTQRLMQGAATDDDVSATYIAGRNLIASFDDIGMDPASRKGVIKDRVRGFIQNKQFDSFHLIKATPGLWSQIDPDDQDKLETMVDRYQGLANTEAASSPEIITQMQLLAAKLSNTERYHYNPEKYLAANPGFVPMSAAEATQEKIKIGYAINRIAGTDKPYFTPEDLVRQGTSIIDLQLSGYKRQVDAIEADERRAQDQQDRIDLERMKNEIKAAAARNAYSTGQAGAAIINGVVTQDQIDGLNMLAWQDGQFGTINTNMLSGAKVTALSSFVQTQVQSAEGNGVTNNWIKHVKNVQIMKNAGQQGLAMALYGTYYEKLDNAGGLIAGGVLDEQAYQATFGKQAVRPSAILTGLNTKQADNVAKATGQVLKELNGGLLGIREIGGGREMNEAGIASTSQVIMGAVAQKFQNREPSKEELTHLTKGLIASGEIGVYGRFGWKQKAGTPQLHTLVGAPVELMDDILYDAVDASLKHLGAEGANGKVNVFYNGDTTRADLTFVSTAKDGTEKYVRITSEELKIARDAYGRQELKNAEDFRRFWVGDGEKIGKQLYNSVQSDKGYQHPEAKPITGAEAAAAVGNFVKDQATSNPVINPAGALIKAKQWVDKQ